MMAIGGADDGDEDWGALKPELGEIRLHWERHGFPFQIKVPHLDAAVGAALLMVDRYKEGACFPVRITAGDEVMWSAQVGDSARPSLERVAFEFCLEVEEVPTVAELETVAPAKESSFWEYIKKALGFPKS